MMGFLKRFFGEAVEKAQEVDAAIATCQFESSNKECSLVQQLKDKQAEKKAVDAEIESFTSDEPVAMEKFMDLLLQMERHHFEMGMDYRSYHMPDVYNSKIKGSFYHHYGTARFIEIIALMTEEDIDAIHNELKSMKNCVSILNKLNQWRDTLEKEIEEIKAQLGIE